MNPSTQSGSSGHRPGPAVACETPEDPRLVAFSAWIRSVDRADWRAGQLATRELRALGISVVLVPKPGDRRGA